MGFRIAASPFKKSSTRYLWKGALVQGLRAKLKFGPAVIIPPSTYFLTSPWSIFIKAFMLPFFSIFSTPHLSDINNFHFLEFHFLSWHLDSTSGPLINTKLATSTISQQYCRARYGLVYCLLDICHLRFLILAAIRTWDCGYTFVLLLTRRKCVELSYFRCQYCINWLYWIN